MGWAKNPNGADLWQHRIMKAGEAFENQQDYYAVRNSV